MGVNELLLIVLAILSIAFVIAAWVFDKERLYSIILVFLILISVIGGKIVQFFGHETNTGNIFYASIFLATYFLIERYGRRAGIRSIWVGTIGVAFFSILLYAAILLVGSSSTSALNAALSTALAPEPRLAYASILAYIFSQNLNVYLYVFLKKKYAGRRLWLRANTCNVVSQLLDSAIFFTAAFWGALPPANIVDVLVTGFVIKVVFIMVASPLLYFNRVEEENEGSYASLTFY